VTSPESPDSFTEKLKWPARMDLALTPTPLERLERLSQRMGVEILIKRDDLTGSVLSGNKVRKLEFLLADALAKQATVVITCGGAQSNHARATAAAATRLGLRCVLALRTEDPARPPPPAGNILLDRLVGAETVWITPGEYAKRGEVMNRLAQTERERGQKPYIIPEGGSNALGSLGYVRFMAELAEQLEVLGPIQRATLIYACGSGGTGAGLAVGQRVYAPHITPVGFAVCDNRDYFTGRITEIACAAAPMLKAKVGVTTRDIAIDDRYVGAGYAKSRPAELQMLVMLAREEGVIVDPVYTGKAFFGMVSELAKNREVYGQRIVFLHTGGIFGLMAKADEILPHLRPEELNPTVRVGPQ
jgi:D-cysteine desulfhydrase